MTVPGSSDCVICAKHHGEGPLKGELVGRRGQFWLYHAPPGDDGKAALGWLFIESERHASYLADLTDDEAAELGRLRTALARALREATGAEFVLTFVLGLGVAHFHEHLVARHRDAPSNVPWHASDELLPRADDQEVAELSRRLARELNLEGA
jgi:ATP adenylyltransferase